MGSARLSPCVLAKMMPALLLGTIVAATASIERLPETSLMEDWSVGRQSWQTARRESGDSELWDVPNACDGKVLNSSAPLTVLFGLSSVWDRIQTRRQEENRQEQPLELHVLGSSYPFEGRSDWSLLAQKRPNGVPRVRVTLVLGTPYQSDNVPPLNGQKNAFLHLRSETSKPKAGKWSSHKEEVICKGEGQWGTRELDQDWSKEKLCRDHGNGLEVVCLEKFYQDAKLPTPDAVVMFSPGYPQIGRRSWDPVLISVLEMRVPLLVSDLVKVPKWGPTIVLEQHNVKAGGKWPQNLNVGEDFDSRLTLRAYGAQLLKSRRNPFPIIHAEDGEFLAKNAVVQIWSGFKKRAKAAQPLSALELAKYEEDYRKIPWKKLGIDDEFQDWFKHPTSRAYENAMRDMLKDHIREEAHRKLNSLSQKQKDHLTRLGMLGSEPHPRKRWKVKDWVMIIKAIGLDA